MQDAECSSDQHARLSNPRLDINARQCISDDLDSWPHWLIMVNMRCVGI